MTDDLDEALAAIRERRALIAAANLKADAFGDVYTAMVQLAREDSAFLLAAVEAALKLHQPVDRGTGPQCKGCATHITFTQWPCPTYRAITAALAGADVPRT